ncbi:Hpt domain-containing protein [Alteromonas sp. 14N.309.X.WAT.G.H12]|uniref:Hpt domain-containing protein n=1 Tax=Alteromonas sp. 14N.309.X.WAT.G.H12 TaxID=3120824 RepID=UPI002FD42D50
MSDLPVLDKPSALSRLMNNEALYNKLIHIFIEQVSNLPPFQADINNVSSDLLLAVHSLKGSAGEIGASALHGELTRVEHRMKYEPEELTDSDFQQVNEQIARLLDVIDPHR